MSPPRCPIGCRVQTTRDVTISGFDGAPELWRREGPSALIVPAGTSGVVVSAEGRYRGVRLDGSGDRIRPVLPSHLVQTDVRPYSPRGSRGEVVRLTTTIKPETLAAIRKKSRLERVSIGVIVEWAIEAAGWSL